MGMAAQVPSTLLLAAPRGLEAWTVRRGALGGAPCRFCLARQAVLSLGSWTGGGQGAGALRVSPLREPFLAEGLLGPGLGRQGLSGAPLSALLRGMSLRGCPAGPKIIPVRGPVRDCPRAFPRPHIKGRASCSPTKGSRHSVPGGGRGERRHSGGLPGHPQSRPASTGEALRLAADHQGRWSPGLGRGSSFKQPPRLPPAHSPCSA